MSKGRDNFDKRLGDVIKASALTYSGKALFAPTPSATAENLGVSKGMLYHDRDGRGYHGALEDVTGLTVIHNGIVLGNPNDVSSPTQIDPRVIAAETAVNGLSEEARYLLLQRLIAFNPAQ